MRRTVLFTGAAAIAMLMGGPAGAREDADVTLTVPGHSSQTPWAAASGDFVAVAFGAQAQGGKPDVYVAVSRDGGRTFGAPVRVNHTPGEARLGGELPPRVGLVARGTAEPEIVVAFGARAETTEIRVARSADGGRSFGTAVPLQTRGAAGDRGWHAMALDDQGTAHVMWLDHRRMATEGHHGAAAAEKAAIDGVMMAERSGLYYARAGLQATPDRELVKGVCYCCKVALATTPGGGLVAAWRHVYQGNVRDIAFIRSTDGGEHFGPPGRVSEDGWHLAGCPDDGPALAIDGAGTAHIVWPTVIEGPTPEGAIFYASSRDLQTFTPRVRIPTMGGPRPMHPQVVADSADRVYVAWDEVVDGVRQAGLRSLRFDEAGQPIIGAARRIGPLGRPASYPFPLATTSGPIVVYVSGQPNESEIRVARF